MARGSSEAAKEQSIANDAPIRSMREDVRRRTEYEGRGRRRVEPDDDTVPPNVARRHRRPSNVSIRAMRDPPDNPSGCVAPAGYPEPTDISRPPPAAVVEHDAAERVVAEPDPIAIARQRPMTCTHVGFEVRPHDALVRNPDAPVFAMVDPRPVRRQLARESLQHSLPLAVDSPPSTGPATAGLDRVNCGSRNLGTASRFDGATWPRCAAGLGRCPLPPLGRGGRHLNGALGRARRSHGQKQRHHSQQAERAFAPARKSHVHQ